MHIDTLEPGKGYRLEIKRAYGQRSLDANSYAWKLIAQIASKMNLPPDEVYRKAISESGGTYYVMPVRDDVLDGWGRAWQAHGIGWWCDTIGAAKTPNYSLVRCWYGSSIFSTKEMYNLIQYLRQDCETLGLPYLTPEEEAQLLREWPHE